MNKKYFKIFLSSLLFLSVFGTSAFADSQKGQKWYLSKIKKTINIKGNEFTALHSQAEWKDLFAGDGSKFIAWAKGKYDSKEFHDFLDSDKFKNKYMEDVRDFCVEFAKDSGKIPSC